MKKIRNAILKSLSFLIVVSLVFVVVGCGREIPVDPTPGPVEVVKVSIEASNTEIKSGDTVNLTVSVTGSDNTEYNITVSEPTILSVTNNVVSVIEDVRIDTAVIITATSVVDSTAKASVTLIVKAEQIDGQVADLTSQMLSDLGNDNITVKGVVTDIYQDFNSSANSSTNKYDVLVKMNDGKWYGAWNIAGNTKNVLTYNYRRGTTSGLTDQYGNVGHGLEKIYINQNNEVAGKTVTDYLSYPSVWEAQHLWNHLDNLQITKFKYDAINKVYEYEINENNMDDLYLMTYLSYSLTPMLEDTILKLYLVVENNEITKLLAQTETLYYGSDTREDADGMSYTTIELTFENIGTTVVEDPAPYEAPQYVEKLAAAIEKMGNATNYTFHTTDVLTYSPVIDSGEYELQSTSSSPLVRQVQLRAVQNYTSSQGTVGCVGQITENAVLFTNTSKYEYTMDGKAYRVEYSGYKQNTNGTYEEFEYSTTEKNLAGTKVVKGNIFDVLPKFDFSANIFEFRGLTPAANGNTYTFVLRESSITKELALEVSAYKYADDAYGATDELFTIVVDDHGNVVSTLFPYQFVGYAGYCSTVYSNIGTTVLDEDLFDNYVPRVLRTSWNQYITKSYTKDHSTKTSYDENTEVVLNAIFGDAASSMPAPSVFIDLFGDGIWGPFYNWRNKGTEEQPQYVDYISINIQSPVYDENGNLTDKEFDNIATELKTALGGVGYTFSPQNSDVSSRTSRTLCFNNDNITIVVTNNGTKHLSIYFYKLGEWTLKK